MIGRRNAPDACYVGNYVDADGALYKPEIARDGSYVILTKAEDVKFESKPYTVATASVKIPVAEAALD